MAGIEQRRERGEAEPLAMWDAFPVRRDVSSLALAHGPLCPKGGAVSATDNIYVADHERQVCFGIEVRVPFEQAARFADDLSGNDDDIILAAETAMRELVGRRFGEEVELWLGPRKDTLRRELLKAAKEGVR